MIEKQKAIAVLEAYCVKCKGLMASTVAECIRILREMPEDDVWIPVGDRLPEDFVSVLVHIPGESPLPTVREAYMAGKGWYARCALYTPDEVTHWMPMPTQPKEEK